MSEEYTQNPVCTTKKLILHQAAQQIGIINPVAARISGVTTIVEYGRGLQPDIERIAATIATNPTAILGKPEVVGFREIFERMGHVSQVPAGERLIRLTQKNGFKRISNLIDAYNVATLEFGSGLGMHDLSRFTKATDIHITRACGNEMIVPIFKNQPSCVSAGDLVYGEMCSAGNIIPAAWLGKRDVDSDLHKVSSTTSELLLVVLGNANTSVEYNRAIQGRVLELIRKTCPTAAAHLLPTIHLP